MIKQNRISIRVIRSIRGSIIISGRKNKLRTLIKQKEKLHYI